MSFFLTCAPRHALISDNVANADALLALGVMSPLAALFHSQARGLLSAAAMLCKHLLEIDSTGTRGDNTHTHT